MWQTISGWPWSAIWAAASAVFSMLTVVVALWALFRWRKQDELKAKMAFKVAVADYFHLLAQLPIKLDSEQKRDSCLNEIKDLNKSFATCHHAWLMSEGLMEEHKELTADWNILYEQHKKFTYGEVDQFGIAVACAGILTKKFVFK